MAKHIFRTCQGRQIAVLLLFATGACGTNNDEAEALFRSNGVEPPGTGGAGGSVGFGGKAGTGGDPDPGDTGAGVGGDGASAGFGVDGSEKFDAASGDTVPSDGPVDGEGGGRKTLPCGDSTCLRATQGCCLNLIGSACFDLAADNCFGSKVLCVDSSDCQDQICCGQVSALSTYNDISCQPTCANANQRRLCEPTADKSCPNSGSCAQSPLLPAGYFVCN